MITVRRAFISDVSFVVPLICDAMGHLIHTFTNGKTEEAISLFSFFFQQENNQYSYRNCMIASCNDVNVGMILTYDGASLHELRKPFFDYLELNFNIDTKSIVDETQRGELYIDCVAVIPEYRGKSIGSILIKAAIDKAKDLQIPNTGLLVSIENTKALHLYQRLGFQKIEERDFMGAIYWHMQHPNFS